MPERVDIQLVVLKPFISIWAPGSMQPGDVFWVHSLEAARHLIEAGLCELPLAAMMREQHG